MTPRRLPIDLHALVRILEKHGFRKVSHIKMRNESGRTLIVPMHQGKDIKPGLAAAILKQAGIDPEEYRRYAATTIRGNVP
jgi:predicted RNA binding protein YcfA (HicA-like mRNA interferase family)